jgi:predicted AlkP superfamily pyrophosphatase or phosphodiesterase
MKKYCLLLLTLLAVTLNSFCQDTTQKIIPNRTNGPAQQKKPYVILISADGFRWDYADKYNAENLIRLRKEGVRSDINGPILSICYLP